MESSVAEKLSDGTWEVNISFYRDTVTTVFGITEQTEYAAKKDAYIFLQEYVKEFRNVFHDVILESFSLN